jgi:hypothetical protein
VAVLAPSPEPVHYTGPEVLDQYVGPLDQLRSSRTVGLRLEVKRDTSLAPIEERVGGVLPARAARRVDMNDVRALVG